MTVASAQKSTIVRIDSSLAGRAVRTVFGTLERTSPALGARLALRLWCRIPRPRRRPAGAADASPGQRVPLDSGAVAVDVRGEGPTVYLLHGWGGRRGQLAALGDALVAAGHRVVALDAPGHGASEPGGMGRGYATLTEFVTALRGVVAALGPAHAIVAHSLGGVAAATAVLDGLPADRLVLVSAPADPIAHVPAFAAVLGLGPRTRAGFVTRMARVSGRPLADFDVPARAAAGALRSRLPRLLVVHDTRDTYVDPSNAAALAAAWPDAERLDTTGLGHRRVLGDPGVVSAVTAFVG
jgi:pimeloyl-ACP methyl ester carboxylesterase